VLDYVGRINNQTDLKEPGLKWNIGTIPSVLWWSLGSGLSLMSEVTLYSTAIQHSSLKSPPLELAFENQG
jgi:hypothetical protein